MTFIANKLAQVVVGRTVKIQKKSNQLSKHVTLDYHRYLCYPESQVEVKVKHFVPRLCCIIRPAAACHTTDTESIK